MFVLRAVSVEFRVVMEVFSWVFLVKHSKPDNRVAGEDDVVHLVNPGLVDGLS